jgi:hypothetical protein
LFASPVFGGKGEGGRQAERDREKSQSDELGDSATGAKESWEAGGTYHSEEQQRLEAQRVQADMKGDGEVNGHGGSGVATDRMTDRATGRR